MRDEMQEMVCPRCGTDDIHETETWFGPVWCCWNCDGEPCEPESRAEYLAAHEDQMRAGKEGER